MTDYRVIWPPSVQADVLRYITATLAGTGRETAELNIALATVEDALRRTPLTAGESRVGNLRALLVPPVGVVFEVNAAAREVVVRAVRYSRGKRR